MAVLHKKEEKIQAVLGRLPKTYSHDQFVAMFIQLFSRDWGRIKSAYIKQTQDKEPGTVVHMPKPELYLKQVLDNFLSQKATAVPKKPSEVQASAPDLAEAEVVVEPKKAKVKAEKPIKNVEPEADLEKPKRKTAVKKTEIVEDSEITEPKKTRKKAEPKEKLALEDEKVTTKKPAVDKPVKEKKAAAKK